MPDQIVVRAYAEGDRLAVIALFREVNRRVAPPELRETFERYVEASIAEEIGRIPEYYRPPSGFWVAEGAVGIAGMFGLEPAGEKAMELRRMYVDPVVRRQGIARRMLAFAEERCRASGRGVMALSTSALQQEALAFYRAAGYQLVREETVEAASNKTIGGGVRRFHFEKRLGADG